MHNKYEKLCRRIITALADHVNPGNWARTMLMQEIHIFRCKMVGVYGNVEKPTRVLVRLERIHEITDMYLQHSQGAVYLSNNDFKNSFWNIFPPSMMNWLTNDQDIDPFDATNPLDVEEIVDQMQHWCNIPGNLKDPGEANKKKCKLFDDGGDDGNNQGRQKQGKKYEDHHRLGNRKPNGGGHKENCKIAGHEKYKKQLVQLLPEPPLLRGFPS